MPKRRAIMSIENLVAELKQKTFALKEFEENDTEVKTRESRKNAIRKLSEDIKTLKVKAADAFVTESQVFLVQTPTDYQTNKEKLAKYGFTADLLSLAEHCSERCVKGVTYKNGIKEGYQMSQMVSLLSSEIREALVEVGVNGRNVPKILGIKSAPTPMTREDLTLATYKIFKNTSVSEQKNFEELNFTYATKDLSAWLQNQKTLSANNKVLVVVSPEVDNKLIQYLQKKTGKAVNVVKAENVQETIDNLKKAIKLNT